MALKTRARSRQASGSFRALLAADFSRGMVRDAPRTALPPNAVYDAADFLLHEQGIAIKRGGSSYAGPALTNAVYCQAVAYADFPAGAQLIAVGAEGTANGHLFKVTPGTTTDLGGTPIGTKDTPKLRVGGGKSLLLIPNADGSTGPLKYDGSAAPSLLGGTPATGKVVAIYKTRVVIGGNTANPNRLFFSPTPDIETTWDTANSWIDCDYAITGLAALHNALLIFSQGHTERILGSTPPPGSDMDRAPVGSVGCTDARSIVVQEGNAIFANPRGVYLTNGAGFASLTTEGLIETYWQSLFTNYDPATWTIAAGIFRGFYFVNILDNTGALVAGLLCYVPRRAWFRLTNHQGAMFSSAVGAQEELYMADRATNRVTKLSGFLTPTAGNKNDANGVAVTPLLELRMLGETPSLKAFGHAELSYDMRDAASDNPTLTVSAAPGLEAVTYAAVPESPLGETPDDNRKRFSVNQDAVGVSLKFAQNNASSKTEIYAVELEARAYPGFADVA